MIFPETFDEFAEQYKIVDSKEIYTNGTELIPIFRVRQWLMRDYPVKNKADVVEVVRCKDCKHCELRYPAKAIGEEAIEGYYCYPNQRYVKSTDFCNYGERRDI